MAAEHTNPVLTLLANVNQLQTERHYPENGLNFAGGYWRAYYHCHESTPMHKNEHGHFHLFTDIGNQHWAHVAGLSIDAEGQALQWFTVNRWVSDGPWLVTTDFRRQLQYISAKSTQQNLVARWLEVLLQLYCEDLYSLLVSRDKKLQQFAAGQSREQILEDREIYQLSAQDIDITRMLENYLLDRSTSVSELNNNNEQTQRELG